MQTLSLNAKISLIVILTITFTMGVNSLYFDSFLKANYKQQTDLKFKQITQRIANDIVAITSKLKASTHFIHDDEALKASIALVNNYQNKQNYNAILLDEEKKRLANSLLEKVKNGLNHFIALYDHNEELIAFVYETQQGYTLNFIAYHNGQKRLFSKNEFADLYQLVPFNLPHAIEFKHQDYYTQPQLKNDSIVTHHNVDNHLYIVAHENLFDADEDTTMAHIEMGDELGQAYLNKTTQNSNMTLSFRDALAPTQTAPNLLSHTDNSSLNETAQTYTRVLSLNTQEDPLYLHIALDKTLIQKTLTDNRYQLILFFMLIVILTVVFAQYLLQKTLSQPIAALMQQIAKLKKQDYSASPLVNTGDELENIGYQINQLARTISQRETQLKASHKHLEYVSTHDDLTQLANRSLFNLELDYALEQVKTQPKPLAVMFLDLDQFKQINDTLGHNIGDELLKQVALRLQSTLHPNDGLARIGGDEFNIFTSQYESKDELIALATRIINAFKKPFNCFDSELAITTSIGIARYPEDGTDRLKLNKNADLAMYQAKENGGNAFSFYTQTLSDSIEKRSDIVQALKVALKKGDEFSVHYQPKIDVHSKKVVGAEALLRWHSSVLGPVRPDEFIPIAEETHLIIELGEWVLKQACQDWVRLQKTGLKLKQISVNVSAIQLQYSDMFTTVGDTLAATGMPATALELEVTESYIATHEKVAIKVLSDFRSMGIDLAIDDFGTGYSSMHALQQLPVTRLKIDKSFVDHLPSSTESIAVVKAIMALAQAFNLKVTVEGLETQAQLTFFEQKCCHDIQGYYFSRPLPWEALSSFLKSHA